MKMNETVAGITISAKTEGIDQAKQATSGLIVATENLERGVISLIDKYNRQTLSLNDAARAQNRMTMEVRLADNAHRQELTNLQQLSTRLGEISGKYGLAAIEASKYANAIKAAAVNSAQSINQRLAVRDDFATPQRAR
jgi:hypothetical protein